MKQFRDKDRQDQDTVNNGYTNGYAHDMREEAESKVREISNMASPEIKGLASLAGGLLLLAHTLGYFASLNWALMAVAIAGIFYGANTSNVWSKVKQAAEYMKDTVSGK